MKRSFTLIELLVVIAIISLLTGILLPVLGQARLQAKVLAVNAEMRQIGLALEMYMEDNNGKHPPTRVNCMLKDNCYQLPEELVEGDYLPSPRDFAWQGAGMVDRFNRPFSYKYTAVGDLIVNLNTIQTNQLWVPDGFPSRDSTEKGQWYKTVRKSPVIWVVYSLGPKFNEYEMKKMHYPVPKMTWYDPGKDKGVIVRMRLQDGRHIGSFEGN